MTVAAPVRTRWFDEPQRTIAVLVVLVLSCWLGIGRDLWTPDEPREAEISREMWLSPDVVPRLNGVSFLEKPPLYYWASAGAFALAGGPSAVAARSISALSAALTLLLVFLWGQKEFSTGVGLAAAIGLTASTQFLMASHWVLIDPLLMLFTTAAAWSAWRLTYRNGGWRQLLLFNLSLALAFWTKGLIGPVLIGSGVLALAAWTRTWRPVLRLHPLVSGATLLLAMAAFAALIYVSNGPDALREWFWVNHVRRFVAPERTGHAEPIYFYALNLPLAVFPWLLPLIDVFRPARWRDATLANRDLRVYLAAMCIGMTVLLTAASTKRSTYLLPLLPLLALLLAAHGAAWQRRWGAAGLRSAAWWTQVALLALFVAAPGVYALSLARLPQSMPSLLALLLAAALLTLLVFASLTGRLRQARLAMAGCAVAGVVGALLVAVPALARDKDMSGFVAWMGRQIPADQVLYGYGDLDETLYGIVPFVTGRAVVPLQGSQLEQLAPQFVVVQDKQPDHVAPELQPRYRLVGEQHFGTGRSLALWKLKEQ